jgi:transposase-like protein
MHRFVPVEALFRRRHFDGQIIILCVSWYTSFKLSLRDLVIMMADRGITLTHTTILRWVQHYLPEFDKRWSRYAGENRDRRTDASSSGSSSPPASSTTGENATVR